MNLSNQRRRRVIVIALIVVMLLALPASILLYRTFVTLRGQAGTDRPTDVVISNVTAEAAVISWISNPNAVIGSVKYSLNQNELDTASSRLAQDDRDIKQGGQAKERLTHYVTLTNLLPSRTYYFRLVSGNATFPGTNQSPLQFTTLGSGIAKVGSPTTAYGEVSNTDDLSKNTIIYATLQNDGQPSTPVSTVIADNRTWFIDLANALENDRTSYFTLNDKTKISILGQAGSKGIKVETTVEFIKSNPLVLNLEDGYPVAQYLPGGSKFPDPGNGTTTTPTATPTRDPNSPLGQDAPLEGIRLVRTTTTEADLPIPLNQPLISNLVDTSVSIVVASKNAFTTRICAGEICGRDDDAEVGENPKLPIHHVTLSNLTAASQYPVTIENFAQESASVTTVTASDTPPSPVNISGFLTSGKGVCVVVIQLQRGSETSGIVTRQTETDYNWQANVGAVRQSAGGALFSPQETDEVIAQAQCFAGSEIYTGKAQATIAEAQQNKMNIRMTKALDQNLIPTGNNVYSTEIFDNGIGGGGSLPDASWSPVAWWLLSIGLVCVAVGSGLIGMYMQYSRRNKWEEEILRRA